MTTEEREKVKVQMEAGRQSRLAMSAKEEQRCGKLAEALGREPTLAEQFDYLFGQVEEINGATGTT